RGLGEQHRDPIDEVLIRHDLALVAEVEGEFTLLGRVEPVESDAWHALQRIRLGAPAEVAAEVDATLMEIRTALERLAARRVVLRRGADECFCALSTLLPTG